MPNSYSELKNFYRSLELYHERQRDEQGEISIGYDPFVSVLSKKSGFHEDFSGICRYCRVVAENANQPVQPE